jgi:exopolyphosphatase / guanosine-5'-triphosphate,3'-diphosphate pyrophosphatase
VENHFPVQVPVSSRGAVAGKSNNFLISPGRPSRSEAIAIIDIGSNSVRLVVYEQISRSPAQIFNEKEMAGLGRQVATTGMLGKDAMRKALDALRRFRILCDAMGVTVVRVIATAAARYASNGPEFIALAEAAVGCHIELIPGEREAYLSALGVVAGFDRPDGVVGDLGGGSLELIEVDGPFVGAGVSLALGGLALEDRSRGSLKAAEKIVKDEIDRLPQIEAMKGRDFYAVGGTWRALATMHQRRTNYPLNVMHGYRVPASDVVDFSRMVERADGTVLDALESVSSSRRPLLAYGALVLEEVIKRGRPRAVVISAQGVREGLLHEQLSPSEQMVDPLLGAVADYNHLRARNPDHAAELIDWTGKLIARAGLDEDMALHRLRKAVCYLSDIGWRAHPDYRGEQSLNVIAHAAFIGIDHPGRAFLALTIFRRYAGFKETIPAVTGLRSLLSPVLHERALVLAAAFRVAYLISAGMPGILPQAELDFSGKRLKLRLPDELRALASDRVVGRLKQLAKLLGRDAGRG